MSTIISPLLHAARAELREDDGFACSECGASTGGGMCAKCIAAEATELAQANLRALQLEAEREELRDELAALRSQLNSANDVAEGERSARVWMAREIQTLAEQAQRATKGSDLERRLAASLLIRAVSQLARVTRSQTLAVVPRDVTPEERAEAREAE